MASVAISLVLSLGVTVLSARSLEDRDSASKDSTIVPRLLFLGFCLTFLTFSHGFGFMPYTAQGQTRTPDLAPRLFNFFVILAFMFLLVQTQEPALALVPIASTLYTIGLSYSQAQPSARGTHFWPAFVAFVCFLATFVFFDPLPQVDSFLDALFSPFHFDPSHLPVGYLSGDHSSVRSGLVLALLIGLAGFAVASAAQKYAANYNTYEPDVARLLDPRKDGLENLARFLNAAQEQLTPLAEGNPLPADPAGPIAFFLRDKHFRANLKPPAAPQPLTASARR